MVWREEWPRVALYKMRLMEISLKESQRMNPMSMTLGVGAMLAPQCRVSFYARNAEIEP